MSDQVAEVSATYLVEATQSAVPVGYKQTEVGIIPDDWKIGPLSSSCSSFKTGKLDANAMKPNGEYRFYTCAREHYFIDHYVFDTEALLVSGNGANVGYVHYFKGKFNAYQRTYVLSEFNADVGYLKVYLETKLAERIRVEVNAGNTPYITMDTLTDMPIIFPSLKEQTAIANVLSDVDALISELEKLIAKKQAIKTASMQQLLTGRTRLPQFALREDGMPKGYKQSELGDIPEDWEVKDFGELFEPSVSRKLVKHSELVSFVGMQDTSESAQLINQTKILFDSLKGGLTYFEKGDVLVAKITPCFENGKGCHTDNLETDIGFGSTEFHILRATEFSDSQFIYFWTTRSSFRVDLESEMVGSAGHRRVPLSAIASYRIPCTKNKEEQTAIANILSNMDEEINALEQRLGKTRQIKQGMMQELLTGKTRLVASTA
ncbi:restriction endonuclease subunit S [Halomonas venusta]|uniref:restriction endonuclease subunit S n=1 Tax=Vreelandella venusta TaxID=44935 RepID=UPI00295EB235|nr:restriction endonuclease subunit S [Halomonas venusta]MDW0360968.1 restriction endonuclease subunit S [Halomonas venusta]